MAAIRATPIELADRLGLSLAAELRPRTVPVLSGATALASRLPVTGDLVGLLPQAGLAGQIAIPLARRGTVSLLWRLLAGPSTAGRWCAIVGNAGLYPLTATAAGADLRRLAFVHAQNAEATLAALGALCEGVPVIVVATGQLTARQMQRAAARARRSGSVIIWLEDAAVPGVDARLEPLDCRWIGLRPNTGRRWGAGRLTSCRLVVGGTWRGGGRVRRVVWPYGGENAEEPGPVPLPVTHTAEQFGPLPGERSGRIAARCRCPVVASAYVQGFRTPGPLAAVRDRPAFPSELVTAAAAPVHARG